MICTGSLGATARKRSKRYENRRRLAAAIEKPRTLVRWTIVLSVLSWHTPAVAQDYGSECTSPKVCPNIDWSFLGEQDDKKASEQTDDYYEYRKKFKAFAEECDEMFGESEQCDEWGFMMHQWFDEQAGNALKGAPVIRIPLFYCVGWGSTVPSNYTTLDCLNPMNAFIQPVGNTEFASTCWDKCYKKNIKDIEKHDACVEKYCYDVMVEGYLTGEVISEVDIMVPAYMFHVLRFKELSRSREAQHYTMSLPAGFQQPQTAPFSDGPQYGVMIANFFMTDTKARENAEKALEQVVSLGYENAVLVDSRQIPPLWCCSWVVLIERFDDKKQAKALVKKLDKKKVKNVVVRKMY